MRKPGERVSGMEPVFSGFVLDPAKCSQLSLEEKRELVHEIAQWSKDAPEILQSWTRRELLEIICAEMGKVRKYTGFTKFKMIEYLLKLVSENLGKSKTDDSSAYVQNGTKRQRKKENPLQLVTVPDHIPVKNTKEDQFDTILCQNLACRATLSSRDVFCKRCSCCICYCYDDNKDPTLWLTCGNDPPNQDDSCGLSCHLKCALKHEKAGISKHGCCAKLDGSFYCVSCGKVNALLGSLRKNLLVAKDARRVDVLYYRISLSHAILKGTEHYKEMQRIVGTAMKKLKKEVGPLDQVSSKMARGIVNRLSCGADVQKLCASVIQLVDSMLPALNPHHIDVKEPPTCNIQFKGVSPTSVVVILEYEEKLLEDFLGCRLWHRKSNVMDYPEKPTFIVLRPEKSFMVSDLDPSSEYSFKVSIFGTTKELGVCEAKWITPVPSRSYDSALDEEHEKDLRLITYVNSQRDSNHSKLLSSLELSKNKCQFPIPPMDSSPLMDSFSVPPATPSKSDGIHDALGLGSKKQQMDKDYEYSVGVIRWLEREGHIEKDFRVKFLTWFSLKATMRERRVVSAFVDTLIDDPPSLAGQLFDTFMDEIGSERKPVHRNGFCTRLWH